MPSYIKDFFFYIGIASLSADFTQAGCPDAPPGDFASKYYAQVVPLVTPPTGLSAMFAARCLASVCCLRSTGIGACLCR
jgi:hypothetical protein